MGRFGEEVKENYRFGLGILGVVLSPNVGVREGVVLDRSEGFGQ